LDVVARLWELVKHRWTNAKHNDSQLSSFDPGRDIIRVIQEADTFPDQLQTDILRRNMARSRGEDDNRQS
jgi:hypothetical protein